MKTRTEIRKEIEGLENKISELEKELYKIETKENKEDADKMIGKCFRVCGTGTWDVYMILYKNSKIEFEVSNLMNRPLKKEF